MGNDVSAVWAICWAPRRSEPQCVQESKNVSSRGSEVTAKSKKHYFEYAINSVYFMHNEWQNMTVTEEEEQDDSRIKN